LLWLNEVDPNRLRINSDEVTYNLHIMLRFDLERSLINQEMEVADLPEAWNEKSQMYLGHVPTENRRGVMQDAHWASGLFGYFSSYTFGHVYAAQFFAQAEKELGNLDELFERGQFLVLKSWLNDKIYTCGAKYRPRQLVRNITGKGTDPKILIEYLNNKYHCVGR
jgi:carboxypeptidase Taq